MGFAFRIVLKNEYTLGPFNDFMPKTTIKTIHFHYSLEKYNTVHVSCSLAPKYTSMLSFRRDAANKQFKLFQSSSFKVEFQYYYNTIRFYFPDDSIWDLQLTDEQAEDVLNKLKGLEGLGYE